MPLTIYPHGHPARVLATKVNVGPSSEKLFMAACPKEFVKSRRIMQTSFNNLPSGGKDAPLADDDPIVLSSHNGFVRAAWDAYAHHRLEFHLRIGPEDVWFAILTQFSFYVNAHTEELREHFVSHEGKKQLTVTVGGAIEQADMGEMALAMTGEIHKNVVDPGLREWIVPDFTTTDKTIDSITAAVIMMGTMQRYFAYRFCCVMCGIPSVTMLGEREDWVKLRARVDKLATFGKQTEKWASLLIPVLDFFVRGWDEPESADVKDFWSRIADYSSGSGFNSLTGWITAFCFFDEDGKCKCYCDEEQVRVQPFVDTNYPTVDPSLKGIPDAFVSVPVEVLEVTGGGAVSRRLATKMVAGSVGLQVSSSGDIHDELYEHDHRRASRTETEVGSSINQQVGVKVYKKTGRDTLQPLSGWWMYELKDQNEAEAKQVEVPKGVTGYDRSQFLE